MMMALRSRSAWRARRGRMMLQRSGIVKEKSTARPSSSKLSFTPVTCAPIVTAWRASAMVVPGLASHTTTMHMPATQREAQHS